MIRTNYIYTYTYTYDRITQVQRTYTLSHTHTRNTPKQTHEHTLHIQTHTQHTHTHTHTHCDTYMLPSLPELPLIRGPDLSTVTLFARPCFLNPRIDANKPESIKLTPPRGFEVSTQNACFKTKMHVCYYK